MNRLKELRKEKKLTQEELAGEIGVFFAPLDNILSIQIISLLSFNINQALAKHLQNL